MASEPDRGSTPQAENLTSHLRTLFGRMSQEERWGWAVSTCGLLVILWGVLHLTNATIGGPIHDFKDRRTYTEVKSAAHKAFPATAALGLAGLGILALGARLRAKGRRSPPRSDAGT